jgi:hypothetical protein
MSTHAHRILHEKHGCKRLRYQANTTTKRQRINASERAFASALLDSCRLTVKSKNPIEGKTIDH